MAHTRQLRLRLHLSKLRAKLLTQQSKETEDKFNSIFSYLLEESEMLAVRVDLE